MTRLLIDIRRKSNVFMHLFLDVYEFYGSVAKFEKNYHRLTKYGGSLSSFK
ncbi:MAG: hypothetical protein QM671_26660 [Bacillus sp. (in: firmicutes)]